MCNCTASHHTYARTHPFRAPKILNESQNQEIYGPSFFCLSASTWPQQKKKTLVASKVLLSETVNGPTVCVPVHLNINISIKFTYIGALFTTVVHCVVMSS